MMVVRSTLSKVRHEYFTFLSSEGYLFLKEYLEGRIRAEEDLTLGTSLSGHERPRALTRCFPAHEEDNAYDKAKHKEG